MSEFSLLQAALVFFVYVAFDILYALYVLCVARKQAFRASAISAGLCSLGAYGVMNYMDNHWYLAPLLCGAFLGTYIAVRFMHEFTH